MQLGRIFQKKLLEKLERGHSQIESHPYTTKKAIKMKDTRKKMFEYFQKLPACSAKAQCLNIANMYLDDDETISDRILRDHNTVAGALRAMQLMEDAGAATHESANPNCFGTFTFEDRSTCKA